jgi:hypothetical protein
MGSVYDVWWMDDEKLAYLADEVESDHVTGLGGDGVWCELELVVGSYGDHHGGSGGCQALGQSREYDVGEEHLEVRVV